MTRGVRLGALAAWAAWLAACGGNPTPSATLPPPAIVTVVSTPTIAAAPASTAASPATAAPLPTLTATPDPYAGWSIDDLRARSYGGGAITVLETLEVTEAFTRTRIAYPSDGLTLYGFMNVPRGAGPAKRPVVIVNHGYIDPANYNTLTYMTRYADPLAAAGFITLHPDYRGYGDSDSGPNPFRIGYAIDVLNLIALVKTLPEADPQAIGLFGHSMGGGISLRTITVSSEVKAALLYGAMSGDERANFAKIAEWRGNPDLVELSVPGEVIDRLAPLNYLGYVQAAVSLHHGDADAIVPPAWTADLDARLTSLGKNVEYFTYPGQPHTFVEEGHRLLMERACAFFGRCLQTSPCK
jgi:dipeptidyl aminopeptidase/acylaminoacyl peptidase